MSNSLLPMVQWWVHSWKEPQQPRDPLPVLGDGLSSLWMVLLMLLAVIPPSSPFPYTSDFGHSSVSLRPQLWSSLEQGESKTDFCTNVQYLVEWPLGLHFPQILSSLCNWFLSWDTRAEQQQHTLFLGFWVLGTWLCFLHHHPLLAWLNCILRK